jgi:hypothetical protein
MTKITFDIPPSRKTLVVLTRICFRLKLLTFKMLFIYTVIFAYCIFQHTLFRNEILMLFVSCVTLTEMVFKASCQLCSSSLLFCEFAVRSEECKE